MSRLRIKARELGTPNDFVFAQKRVEFFGMTSNYCYLTEKNIYSIPDFPQKRAFWLASRRFSVSQLSQITGEKFLTCFQTGKRFKREQWHLKVPDGRE